MNMIFFISTGDVTCVTCVMRKTTTRKDQNEQSWMPWAHRTITIHKDEKTTL